MRLRMFRRSTETNREYLSTTGSNVFRVEVPMESGHGLHTVMLLDADDSFDVVVQYPNAQREIIWSLIKEA